MGVIKGDMRSLDYSTSRGNWMLWNVVGTLLSNRPQQPWAFKSNKRTRSKS